MSENFVVTALCEASKSLERVSNDDCCVILQDWNPADNDERIAMRLAAEVLNLREFVGKVKDWLMKDAGPGHIAGDMRVYELDGCKVGVLLDEARALLGIDK